MSLSEKDHHKIRDLMGIKQPERDLAVETPEGQKPQTPTHIELER